MGKIIYTKNINDISKKKKSINLMILILTIIFILLLVISIHIYEFADNENISENTNNIITNNNQTRNILTVGITNKEDSDTQENNTVTDYNNGNNSTENNSQNNSNIHYASNGEPYSIIANLNIPSLGINYPILSSTSTALLKISLNKYWGSNPNEVGNMVVVGHNYKNSKFFGNLSKIQIGDIVKITDISGRTLDYTVYHTDIIDPYDNSCTSQLTNGYTETTLITCYNNGTQRFVVKARAN